MLSQKIGEQPFISIGEDRNEAGEPLVRISPAGTLGPLEEIKAAIARYEAHAISPKAPSSRAAGDAAVSGACT